MVSLTRYAAGAADGCMNESLSREQQDRFLWAYHEYDSRASAMLERAVYDLDQKFSRKESFNVMPLYVATLLYHAAGVSCLLA